MKSPPKMSDEAAAEFREAVDALGREIMKSWPVRPLLCFLDWCVRRRA